MAPRTTPRTQPTTHHRDAGRERLVRLTGWIAAGGIAGVGIFSVVAATSAPAKTAPPTTIVLTPSTGGEIGQPATVPPTVPPDTSPAASANDPAYGGVTGTVPPKQVLQAPAQPPATTGRRHHQDAAATTGGS